MNRMDDVRMEKWWNEIYGRRKQENPRDKSAQTPICVALTPHGLRTRDPSAF